MSSKKRINFSTSIKCRGLLGMILGHKYHHVYDNYYKDIDGPIMVEDHKGKLVEAYRNGRYLFSMCKRCGDVK